MLIFITHRILISIIGWHKHTQTHTTTNVVELRKRTKIRVYSHNIHNLIHVEINVNILRERGRERDYWHSHNLNQYVWLKELWNDLWIIATTIMMKWNRMDTLTISLLHLNFAILIVSCCCVEYWIQSIERKWVFLFPFWTQHSIVLTFHNLLYWLMKNNNTEKNKVPITILTGFLGAGKVRKWKIKANVFAISLSLLEAWKN
jgi:hypothetical protein